MGPNWAQDEGAKDFRQGRNADQNPYPHDNQHWWHNEEWEKGWEAAEDAWYNANNDDDDG